MGRRLPEVQLPLSIGEEVALAQVLDEAIAHVLATRDWVEQAIAAAVERALPSLDGTSAAAVRPVSGVLQQAVALDGVEVTQAVQDLDHSVPLVAGKTAIVRVYLSYPQAVTVRGELQVARSPSGPWQAVTSLGSAQLDPSRSGGSLAQLRSRRADFTYSLNFRLPAELAAAGNLWIRMGEIQRTDTGTVLPSLAGLATRMVTFRRAAPLRLRLVRLRYRMGSPPRTHEPSGTDVNLIASWLRRAYPIARLDMTTTTADAAPTPEFAAAQINAQLISLRAVDVATGTDARTHYYGMVADSGFFMRGRASDIPQTPRPGTVASGPTGPGSAGWDFDGSYGDWYGGHELAHTLGRFHVLCQGDEGGAAPYPYPGGKLSGPDEKFVGIDVGDPALGLPMQVLPGTMWTDVMTYCDNEWLSDFTYRSIFDRLAAEDALPAGSDSGLEPRNAARIMMDAGGIERAEAPAMRLIAALNLTRTSGSITAVLPMSEGAQEGAATGAEPYGVTIRVRDTEGTTLDERPATFTRSACEDPDEDVTGVIDVDVPTPAGAASVELLVDGQVVDSQPIGGEAVPLGAFAGTDEAAGAGETPGAVELRWEQPDAPAGQRYIVQTSQDAGVTWRTVAVGLTEPAVSLPRDELPGDEVTVRVFATTGSGATLVRTDTVRVR